MPGPTDSGEGGGKPPAIDFEEEKGTRAEGPAAKSGGDRNTSSGTRTRLGPGMYVGEYKIEALIGRGGMGVVYRAIQPLIGKMVAIKVLDGVLAKDEVSIKRFVLEARSVNEIGHRNLVDIFSFGRLTDGRYYYVMEFLAGRSLGQVLKARKRLTPAEAVPVFRDLCLALEAAHKKGVVHRDLKPDNVLLVPDGEGRPPRAKLLDFGLAKLIERADAPKGLTQAGSAVGTPQYMAPQQCLGQDVDGRTDVYALGVLMFRTLTGKPPFEGQSLVEIWQAHVYRPPPKPSDLAPDNVTPDLERLILTMLEKAPANRIQSAGEVADALDQLTTTRVGMLSPLVSSGSMPLQVRPTARAQAAVSFDIDMADVASNRLVSLDGATATTATPPSVDVEIDSQPAEPMPREKVRSLEGSLGLTIIEPALSSHDPSQISLLQIEIGKPRIIDGAPQAEEPAPAPLIRAIKERGLVPDLKAPVATTPKADPSKVARRRSRTRIILALVALAIAGLATAAVLFTR